MNSIHAIHELRGAVLQCDPSGTVKTVLYDTLFGKGLVNQGENWTQILDSASYTKSENFTLELRAKGQVFNWELNVRKHAEISSWHFAGILLHEGFMILVAKNVSNLAKLVTRFNPNAAEEMQAADSVNSLQAEERLVDDAIYDDITLLNNELVNLQRTLVKKNIELERLNELKNRFLGIAAHDLRNPLGNVLNLLEFFEDEADQFSEHQIAYLQQINSLIRFMLNMVEDLLDVSSIEAGKIQLSVQVTDLIPLIDQNVFLNRFLAHQKDIDLRYSSDIESVKLLIDPGKIQQVINNLITNAIKYSSGNSTVFVKTFVQDNEIVTAVKDHGVGIPKTEQSRLFKPFQKTSAQSPHGDSGTGLGLYIVHTIIHAHRGQVWLQSEPGKGSTFFFSLPENI